MRFPLWEGLEIATTWFITMAPIVGGICGLLRGWRIGPLTGGLTVLLVALAAISSMAALPLPHAQRCPLA